MNLVNSKHHFIEISYPFYVLVILDSLFLDKTRKPHDVLLRWQDEFLHLGIPIILLSNDPSYVVHTSFVQYIYCVDESAYRYYDRIVEKNVFGETKKVIVPGIFVIQGNRVVKSFNRVNDKSVCEVYLYVLKWWTKKQIKKVKKIIDKGFIL